MRPLRLVPAPVCYHSTNAVVLANSLQRERHSDGQPLADPAGAALADGFVFASEDRRLARKVLKAARIHLVKAVFLVAWVGGAVGAWLPVRDVAVDDPGGVIAADRRAPALVAGNMPGAIVCVIAGGGDSPSAAHGCFGVV
jgi:hypothetical protein